MAGEDDPTGSLALVKTGHQEDLLLPDGPRPGGRSAMVDGRAAGAGVIREGFRMNEDSFSLRIMDMTPTSGLFKNVS